MMNPRVKRILAVIGPYPYNPILIFLFFVAIYFSRFLTVVVAQPQGLARWEAAPVVLLLAALPSGLFAVTSLFAQRYRRWSDQNLLGYIFEVAVGQSILFICAPFLQYVLKRYYHFHYQAPITLTPGFFLGSLVLVLIVLGLMHSAERVIARRLMRADELVAKLEVDRKKLILSDEELRRQTSAFLHDRVQSDLMVVSMQLKQIQNYSEREIQSALSEAVSRLEEIRSSDLRNLVQILAPNLQGIGFSESLEDFKRQYKATLNITFDIDSAAQELNEGQQLGLFRIIEQSLLNSLIHAGASDVNVSIVVENQNTVRLVVSDTGVGVDLARVKTGVGSTVIDSWVSILKADKTIKTSPGNGYVLSVSFDI
jgi:signal transduction histidine kinase